jgi:hypothetical protein
MMIIAKADVYKFGCYAPPGVYGTWCYSPEGIAGADLVTIRVEPEGDTTITCKMNCCGQIQEFMDEIQCSWNCAGTAAISCYGDPTGSIVDVYQTS